MLEFCQKLCCGIFSGISVLFVATAVALFIAVVAKKRRRETVMKLVLKIRSWILYEYS